MEIFKLFRVGSLIGVILCALPQGCRKNGSGQIGEPHHNTKKDIRSPVEVSAFRDIGSQVIVIEGGKQAGGWELYFVPSDEPNIGWKIFTEAKWRDPNYLPLPRSEALRLIGKVEDLLKKHYGTEFTDIRKKGSTYDQLTIEEITGRIDDPAFIDALNAHYALTLIDEYRNLPSE